MSTTARLQREGQARVRELRQQGSWRRKPGRPPAPGGDPKAHADAIKEAGINSHYYVSPETAHEWQSWRRSLRELAPLLFQEHPVASTVQEPPKPSEPAATSTATTVRINAGGLTPFTDSKGQVWSPDQGFEAGNTVDRDPNTEITGTEDPGLFLTEHYDMNFVLLPTSQWKLCRTTLLCGDLRRYYRSRPACVLLQRAGT